MRALLAFLLAAAGLSGTASYAGPWQRALPGWEFTFPGDHYSHPAFRTEWWYVTGSIRAADGREFGYQFTIFRRGILPPEERGRTTSRFVVNDLALGHFTLTDVSGARFYHDQKMSRGAWGDAGFGDVESGRPAWIGGCGIRCHPAGGFSIISQPGSAITLKLDLVPERPVVIHGENGVSRKAAGEGNASHYYSITRMKSTGTLELKGETLNVSGTSWLDREWATNQLAAAGLASHR